MTSVSVWPSHCPLVDALSLKTCTRIVFVFFGSGFIVTTRSWPCGVTPSARKPLPSPFSEVTLWLASIVKCEPSILKSSAVTETRYRPAGRFASIRATSASVPLATTAAWPGAAWTEGHGQSLNGRVPATLYLASGVLGSAAGIGLAVVGKHDAIACGVSAGLPVPLSSLMSHLNAVITSPLWTSLLYGAEPLVAPPLITLRWMPVTGSGAAALAVVWFSATGNRPSTKPTAPARAPTLLRNPLFGLIVVSPLLPPRGRS